MENVCPKMIAADLTMIDNDELVASAAAVNTHQTGDNSAVKTLDPSLTDSVDDHQADSTITELCPPPALNQPQQLQPATNENIGSNDMWQEQPKSLLQTCSLFVANVGVAQMGVSETVGATELTAQQGAGDAVYDQQGFHVSEKAATSECNLDVSGVTLDDSGGHLAAGDS